VRLDIIQSLSVPESMSAQSHAARLPNDGQQLSDRYRAIHSALSSFANLPVCGPTLADGEGSLPNAKIGMRPAAARTLQEATEHCAAAPRGGADDARLIAAQSQTVSHPHRSCAALSQFELSNLALLGAQFWRLRRPKPVSHSFTARRIASGRVGLGRGCCPIQACERISLECGLTETEEAQKIASIAAMEIRDRIAGIPATTLVGLMLKARYAAEHDQCAYDEKIMTSIVDDLLALSGEA
jgi:hypothetical protein